MNEITIHTMETAPDSAKENLAAVTEKFGFIPNILGALSSSPSALNAYLAIMGGSENLGTLSPADRQFLYLCVSVENQCHYCVPAHTGGCMKAGVDGEIIEAVRTGAPISDKHFSALRDFVRAVVAKRGHVDQADKQAFLNAGFSRDHVLEILPAVAVKTISNYTNAMFDVPLDDVFRKFEWQPAT